MKHHASSLLGSSLTWVWMAAMSREVATAKSATQPWYCLPSSRPRTVFLSHTGMLGRGIGLARPVTVVDDGSSVIVLYSHPSTLTATRGVEDYRTLGLYERIDLRSRMVDPGVGKFRAEKTPDNHVLTLTAHDSWHSVMLFWSSEWQFKTLYVNLQSPIRPVCHGVQHPDYELDIGVWSDMSWSWKDEVEFAELVAPGFFGDDQVSWIRSEVS